MSSEVELEAGWAAGLPALRTGPASATEHLLMMQSAMLDVSVDCIKVIDLSGRVVHMNRAGCAALGVTAEQAAAGFGMPWLDLLPAASGPPGRRALRACREGRRGRFDGMSIDPDGRVRRWDNLLTPLMDQDGSTSVIVCVSRDVTAQREAEERLRVASEVDELTGLLNRRAFRGRLRRQVAAAGRSGTSVVLMIVDLDHFKTVNDTAGHRAGDHLLTVIARRLQEAAPEGALVGRIGGDEFAVCAVVPAEGEEADALAARVHQVCDLPVAHAGRSLNGGASIGYATLGEADDDVTLIAYADRALNALKAAGRGGVRRFVEPMLSGDQSAEEALSLVREMLERGTGRAFYQPQVRLEDGTCDRLEAVLRWPVEDGSLSGPDEVPETLGHFEIATAVHRQLRDQALADLLGWRARGWTRLRVGLDLAPVHLLDRELPHQLLDALAGVGVPPAAVEVEVPEEVFSFRGGEIATASILHLRAAGVRIAVDHFGTGQSVLARLGEQPIDTIKIDASFVARAAADPVARAMIEAIATLGRAVGATVVALGVDTQDQRGIVSDLGVVLAQGDALGRALDASAIAPWLGRTGERATTGG